MKNARKKILKDKSGATLGRGQNQIMRFVINNFVTK